MKLLTYKIILIGSVLDVLLYTSGQYFKGRKIIYIIINKFISYLVSEFCKLKYDYA